MKVAEFIMARLAFLGISQAYCVTGGAAMHLNDALGAEPGIAVRYMHHEQACSIAAEGYARISWTPALVQVTAGPGAINAMNGVFGAFTDSIPMVVVSGQVRSDTLAPVMGPSGLRQLGDQELRTIEMVEPITKWAAQVSVGSNLTELVDRAYGEAVHGRPGPVWIDVPVDVQGSQTTEDPRGPLQVEVEGPDEDTLEAQASQILAAIGAAERPLILSGSGVRIASVEAEVLQLAEAFELPIVTAWTHDTIPSDHHLYAGRAGTIGTRAGNFAVQAADLLLVLGSRLNIRQVSYNWSDFAKNARVVHVDIDPAELDKHYLVSEVRIQADLGALLPKLLERTGDDPAPLRPEWMAWIRGVRRDYEPRHADYPDRPSGVNAYHFVMALGDSISGRHVVASGDATACIVPFQVLGLPAGARLFSNSGCASMGYDLPAAIGAADAAPDRPVWCLAGDGSVMMNLQELQTLKDSGRDLVLFILDNDGYLSIKQTQRNFFGRDFGSSPASGVGFPDFAAVGRAFGLPVTEIGRSEGWRDALSEVIAGSGPRVCVVHLDLEQEFEPRLKSKMTPQGIVTPSLDDMFPHLPQEEIDGVRRGARTKGSMA